MGWFFAYGKPKFVLGALAANWLLNRKPKAQPAPQSPRLFYRFYNAEGNVIGEPVESTQEAVDNVNRGFIEEGSALRCLSQPPFVAPKLAAPVALPETPCTYRLFDLNANKFYEPPQFHEWIRENAEISNKLWAEKSSPYRWVQIG